ncbi:glycosyltransferase [Candidatus Thioglobus sp.]|nr:glycosyltransferase [Candidatus Thioglobus sp.]
MNVAFLTTIFPIKEEYLSDFFDSLLRQTYKDFDIVVVNDGYENFKKITNSYSELNIIELEFSDTPAKNREYGINYCLDNDYELLIFGDIDDYFSSDRVKESIDHLKSFDIVVNDLSLFNANGIYEKQYISHRLEHGSIINFDYIKDKNIFGLSNTAIRLSIMGKVNIDKNVIAVDWFIYKGLLKMGYSAVFINTAETFYRQYDSNIVGLNNANGNYLLWWEE